MTAAKADVIVFLAHVFDEEIERRFFKLKQECSELCDVVVLAEQGSTIPPNIAPFTRFFDFSALKQMAKSVISSGIVPGNCHLRSIDYYRRFPHYRHYWFVEYDVVYTGNWGHLISSLADDPSDLLASHVRTLADEPDWYWRKSFSTGTDPIAQDGWILALHADPSAEFPRLRGRGQEGERRLGRPFRGAAAHGAYPLRFARV